MSRYEMQSSVMNAACSSGGSGNPGGVIFSPAFSFSEQAVRNCASSVAISCSFELRASF